LTDAFVEYNIHCSFQMQRSLRNGVEDVGVEDVGALRAFVA
jgi:hypothetical protein